ncbi:RCC1 domain-containing protein 1 isoform X2 [Tenrec ecaudatus]|uniref:RCC1 domain-containing protein 1 isoform X2 n=1 Tax=Tenrec ecaudatus TaxID=94439 RepID=UPI003F5A2EE7
MAVEGSGAWFGFGFCGFGQALGSGCGRQVHSPEPLEAPCAGVDICRVSASWSYTALVTRGGGTHLSGAARGAARGCGDAWASEALLVVRRGPQLQAWSPPSALCGEPLWTHAVAPDAAGTPGPAGEAQAGALPLLPGACAYVSPRPPFYRPLAPELRARRLELGAEHAVLLGATGQVFSWGSGRHGQLGHGTLEAEQEPRLLEALQGLPMAEVAAGGWHSVCVSATGLARDGSEVTGAARTEDRTPAPFISVQPFPALLDLPLDSTVVKASCGSRHTAVVTRTGELYTWGWGKYGQLGHKGTSSLDRPCRVEYFVDKQLQVQAVTCGPWNTYVYAVEKGKS